MRKKFKVSYELVMVLILVAMCLLFGVLTDGLFLKPKTMIGCTSAIQSCGLEGQCIFNGIATPSDSEAYLENGNMTTVVLWQAYDLGYLAINTAYSAVAGELESGATEYVSNLCGQTQVEGVSTYADTHKVDGATVYLGGPATFTLDTLSLTEPDGFNNGQNHFFPQ